MKATGEERKPWLPRSKALAIALTLATLQAQERHLPIYDTQATVLYAKVKMADKTALSGLPEVEAVCGGLAYPLGFADARGNFHLTLVKGEARFEASFNSGGATMDLTGLSTCEIRAWLPGYRSRRTSLAALREMKDANTIGAGDLVLSRAGAPPATPDAAEKKPSKEARVAYQKGATALADSKWQEAKADFVKAAELSPSYYAAWIGIGLAEEALKDFAGAEAAYKQAVKLDAHSPDAYFRIARAAARSGDWQHTAEYSEAAMGLDPTGLVEGYSLCAVANVKLQKWEVAGSSAKAGLRLDAAGDYPDLWLSLSLAQAGGKHYVEAAASLQKYLSLARNAETIPDVRKELADLRSLMQK